MNFRIACLSLVLACTAIGATAQTAPAPGASTPLIDARQKRQEKRIEQGKASGELNRREAHRLERQQDRIEKAEARAKADGTVTRAERSRLHNLQDETSRNIRRQKHDRQHRPAQAASAP